MPNLPAKRTIDVPKRRSRLSEDWLPSERARAKSLAEYGHLDLRSELEQFKNHHIAKGSLMLDWDRAWYTWLGNTRRFGTVAPRRRTNDDKIRELMEMDVARGE